MLCEIRLSDYTIWLQFNLFHIYLLSGALFTRELSHFVIIYSTHRLILKSKNILGKISLQINEL